MKDDKSKISKIIKKSGNDFHSKVAKELEQLGWSVVNSPHYNDPDSGKAREIDIIASKEYPINYTSFASTTKSEKLVVKLFIECKYIKNPVVFWFKKKDISSAINHAKDNLVLRDKPDFYLNAREKHHYISNEEVANRWSQDAFDVFNDAQNKVLKAMLFFNDSANHYEIRYPVIAVNNFEKLAERRDNEEGFSMIKNNFQIEVNYSYKEKNGGDATKYFLIDVVSSPLLEGFIDNIEENDIALLRNSLAFDLRNQSMEEGEREEKTEIDFDPYDVI